MIILTMAPIFTGGAYFSNTGPEREARIRPISACIDRQPQHETITFRVI